MFEYTEQVTHWPTGQTHYDVEQGGSTWFDLRKGVPTSSAFDRILTPAQAKPSASQKKYIAALIGERLALMPPENAPSYMTRAMQHGRDTENAARLWYAATEKVPVLNGGFVLSPCGRFGCSPDFLTPDGCGELKCPQPETHALYLMEPDSLLADYRCQVHGQLIVTGRPWVDLMSYCPGEWGTVKLRVFPDDFTEKLREELDRFHTKLAAALERFRPAEERMPF